MNFVFDKDILLELLKIIDDYIINGNKAFSNLSSLVSGLEGEAKTEAVNIINTIMLNHSKILSAIFNTLNSSGKPVDAKEAPADTVENTPESDKSA